MRNFDLYRSLGSLLLLGALMSFSTFSHAGDDIKLKAGLVIKTNTVVKPGNYKLFPKDKEGNTGVITIEGDNITVEFRGATMQGADEETSPDQYAGTAIVVKGKNVSIRNLTIKGYKIAIYAENSDNFEVFECNLSYNYRPLLKSGVGKEDESDWLSFHKNEADEWKRYGAAIYLKNCQRPKLRGNTVSNGMNGFLLVNSNDGRIWNNTVTYNSGIGIGLYRSSKNRILHNKLDYNVRGMSFGFYSRGQDAAAILIYEQSNENLIAYNSATHSGDGLFLWAGQSTMDSGEGGCNDNVIYGNDFSYAVTNGVEATFSRNVISNNIINECKNGVWAGYSYNSQIIGNTLKGNEVAVAIEHGQGNTLAYNKVEGGEKGIHLWERDAQPADWAYPTKKDVSSKDNSLKNNTFTNVKIPFAIKGGSNTTLTQNDINRAEVALQSEKSTNVVFRKNNIKATIPGKGAVIPKDQSNNENFFDVPVEGFKAAAAAFDAKMDKVYVESFAPEKMKDGVDALAAPVVPKGQKPQPKGRKYIVITPQGPYNFEYPVLTLTDRGSNGNYTFEVLGPKGSYRVISATGIPNPKVKTGPTPAVIKISGCKEEPKEASLIVEYTGAPFKDAMGNEVKTDKNPYRMEWKVKLP
jgi:parallel beta-helix repeat protein